MANHGFENYSQGEITYIRHKILPNKNVVFKGYLLNGKRNGKCHVQYPDGGRYTGEYKNNKRHGQGTFTYPDERTYTGGYKNDKRHGQGTFTYPDGRTYTGGYKNDKRHGWGVLTDSNRVKTICNWKNVAKVGEVSFVFPENHDGLSCKASTVRFKVGAGGIGTGNNEFIYLETDKVSKIERTSDSNIVKYTDLTSGREYKVSYSDNPGFKKYLKSTTSMKVLGDNAELVSSVNSFYNIIKNATKSIEIDIGPQFYPMTLIGGNRGHAMFLEVEHDVVTGEYKKTLWENGGIINKIITDVDGNKVTTQEKVCKDTRVRWKQVRFAQQLEVKTGAGMKSISIHPELFVCRHHTALMAEIHRLSDGKGSVSDYVEQFAYPYRLPIVVDTEKLPITASCSAYYKEVENLKDKNESDWTNEERKFLGEYEKYEKLENKILQLKTQIEKAHADQAEERLTVLANEILDAEIDIKRLADEVKAKYKLIIEEQENCLNTPGILTPKNGLVQNPKKGITKYKLII